MINLKKNKRIFLDLLDNLLKNFDFKMTFIHFSRIFKFKKVQNRFFSLK